jgi:hypothetical protein
MGGFHWACIAITVAAPGCAGPRTPDRSAPTAEDLAQFGAKKPEESAEATSKRPNDVSTPSDFSRLHGVGSQDLSWVLGPDDPHSTGWAGHATRLGDESEYTGRVIPLIIEGVVRDRAAGFRACKDDIPGMALFKLYISANGQRVVSRMVKSTLSTRATACLEREWDKAKMPAPDGGPAIAMVPIRFDK